MCVLDPIKVTITNYEGSEDIEASYYPHDVPKEGSRKIPFSKTVYIEREDFSENPVKGYNRLTPNQAVRLRHAYIITCEEIIKDEDGNIIEIKALYNPNSKSGNDTSGIKVKSAIQWVDANTCKKIEVRLYDRLYKNEAPEDLDDLNPNSLSIIKDALIEPAVITDKVDERFQFERQGYFYADPIDYSDEAPVFNKIVGLKDSWAKKTKMQEKPEEEIEKKQEVVKKEIVHGEAQAMTSEQQSLFTMYTSELELNNEVSNILARDENLSFFFEEGLLLINSPTTLANIVANDIAKELKDKDVDELKFTATEIAELVKMIDEETISTKIAKQVFEEMVKTGETPSKIVKEKGLVQISNPEVLLPIIDEVIENNPENVEKYKNGNQKLFGFFVGQVIKATQGKANPKIVNELVTKQLNS